MNENSKAPSEIETVTVTMSRETAEAVQIACEWYLRLHMGQFWDLAEDLCMAKFYSDAKRNAFKTKEQRDNAFTVSIHRRNDMQNELDSLYRRYVLPAPISDMMEIPYRAEQVWLGIRYALSWHDRPEGDPWNVCFDKPLNRSDQPQPTIKLTEVQCKKKLSCDGNAQSLAGQGNQSSEPPAGMIFMAKWRLANELPPLYEKPFEDDNGKIIRTFLSDPLLITLNNGEMRIAQFDGNYWFDGSGTNYSQDITHWMPLPEPPEV